MSSEQPKSEPGAGGVVQVMTPSPEAAARGVACHFKWFRDDVEAEGDVSRNELGLIVSRVAVTALGTAGVTHSVLRRVPLGEVLRFANTTNLLSDPYIAAATTAPAELRATREDFVIPPGRVSVTDDLLRHVALVYLQEAGPGKDRAVLQRMEQRLGRPKGTIRGWIKRAREEGWLGVAVQGRLGAEPGGKLLAWLGEQLNSDEAVLKEADRIGRALGVADPGVSQSALRGYRDPAELEYSSRLGVGPLLLAVVAEVLYGRPVGEELAARRTAGTPEEAALGEIAAEVFEKIEQHTSHTS